MPLPSYLRTHRKRWALTQGELGILLGGISGSAVAKYELLTRQPPTEVVLGCEFIFNTSVEEIFPVIAAGVTAAIMLNAQTLLERLLAKPGRTTETKIKLLRSIIERVEAEPNA